MIKPYNSAKQMNSTFFCVKHALKEAHNCKQDMDELLMKEWAYWPVLARKCICLYIESGFTKADTNLLQWKYSIKCKRRNEIPGLGHYLDYVFTNQCRESTLPRCPQGAINNLTLGQTGRYKNPVGPLIHRMIFRYWIHSLQTSWTVRSLG